MSTDFANMWFPNHDKNVPEQKTMTVETVDMKKLMRIQIEGPM